MVLQYSAILACCLALTEKQFKLTLNRHLTRYIIKLPLYFKAVNFGQQTPQTAEKPHSHILTTYESTWFSKDRMTGYGEVLKALSAIASITSCSQYKE